MESMGLGARRAVEAAEAEARALGHDRVGTEHLLLGLVAGEATAAGEALLAAGLTLAAVRHKVGEAVGSTSAPPAGDLPRTARADRAIARSVRFSHARHADAVGTEHLLLGVLDVEGTAGQVLRGLGVDVDRLRASLDHVEAADPDAAPEPEPPPTASGDIVCPTCGTHLTVVVLKAIPRSTHEV